MRFYILIIVFHCNCFIIVIKYVFLHIYFMSLKYYSEKGSITQEKVSDLKLISLLSTKEQPKANAGWGTAITNPGHHRDT